jgi:glycosyltransferase involved in cell wall biosynthesis
MIAGAEIKKVKRGQHPEAKFSILIPTWNNLDYLKLCINSIRKNSEFRHQIILHLNEATDGTLEWVEQQNDIEYTYSKQNIGVCYALNICRPLMETEYLLYMNDDMYVCPGWDKELLNEIQEVGHNNFFISSTCIEPKAQSNCMIQKDYGSDIKNFNEQKLLDEFASLKKEDWQGSTWPPNVVHKDVWDLVGGYSVEFSPGMYSDPDFSMKLWNAGIRYFKGISKSRAYHFGSKSVKRIVKNPGYYKFISKWGITTSTLSKYYLRRGEVFEGPLKEPVIPFKARAKNLMKNIGVAFRRN